MAEKSKVYFADFRCPTFRENLPQKFARLLMTTYLDNISGYNGEKVEYTGEKLSAKGNRAEVSSIVTLGDGKKVPVDYRLMDKDGKWFVYDIIIENVCATGVSVVATANK